MYRLKCTGGLDGMHAYCCLDMQSIPPAMSHHYLSSEAPAASPLAHRCPVGDARGCKSGMHCTGKI